VTTRASLRTAAGQQRAPAQLGTSAMARLIAEHEWAKTPLGPIAEWPDALWQALTLILHSAFQLAIYWGPELILLYNDAEREPLGYKHPEALGQPARLALSEIWPEVGPMLEGVLATGEPTWSEDAPLVFRRGRGDEEAYFTWSYGPIFGESGVPEGVLLVSAETTRHVLGERRLRNLNALAEQTAQRRSLDEIWRRSVDALVQDPDILLAELRVDAEGRGIFTATAEHIRAERLASLSDSDIEVVRRSGATAVRRARLDESGDEDCSVVVVPIPVSAMSKTVPVLALCFKPLRRVGRGERDYAQLLARQIGAAAADAAALEEEHIRVRGDGAAEERKRIQRDLHDSIQRQLVGARLVTELTRGMAMSDPAGVEHLLGELSDQLASAAAELREIAAGQYPSSLSTQGLVEAVRLAAATARLAVEIKGSLGRFDEAMEHELYYAVVEAIQNAFKHGGPGTRVGVRFRREAESVVVLVYDSGRGFDRQRTLEGRGMRNMRERLEFIGGTCQLRSSVNRGTCVRCKCPLGQTS
jgi:signal transduction histidine kinase